VWGGGEKQPASARWRPVCGTDKVRSVRLFHSVVLPSGVFRGTATSTFPNVPGNERDRWPWR
jgi:hypothetical protein